MEHEQEDDSDELAAEMDDAFNTEADMVAGISFNWLKHNSRDYALL